jgi:hypothetical protein
MLQRRLHTLTCRLCVTAMLILPLPSYVARPAYAADTLVASPDGTAPQPPPQPRQSLSDSANAHQSVIAPPPTGDTAINKGAPPTKHFPTPVIQPPKSSNTPSTSPPKE